MSEWTTEDLIHRARAGDRACLDLLWRQHRRYVAAVLFAHRAGPGDDLEDLLQEVAVVLVRKLGELRDPGAFRGWLRTIALNVLRTRRRRPAAPVISIDGVARAEVIDPEIERVERREEQSVVLRALSRLPDDQREALVLKSVEGVSQREIARRLGVPETTIESRLARARRRLREELAGMEGGVRSQEGLERNERE